jgi:plasmid stabilization system protein ParE
MVTAGAYHVILTSRALVDLQGIASYIRQSSPQNAAEVDAKIRRSIDKLSLMPGRFKRVGRSRKRLSPVHGMVVRPFLVYYRVDELTRNVFVLSVQHGARKKPRSFD